MILAKKLQKVSFASYFEHCLIIIQLDDNFNQRNYVTQNSLFVSDLFMHSRKCQVSFKTKNMPGMSRVQERASHPYPPPWESDLRCCCQEMPDHKQFSS